MPTCPGCRHSYVMSLIELCEKKVQVEFIIKNNDKKKGYIIKLFPKVVKLESDKKIYHINYDIIEGYNTIGSPEYFSCSLKYTNEVDNSCISAELIEKSHQLQGS